MDPRQKTAGSFRERGRERGGREDDTGYIAKEKKQRERECVRGTDARQSGAVFVTNAID